MSVPDPVFSAFRKVIAARPSTSERLSTHETRVASARDMTALELAKMLQRKAMSCSTKASARPLVTITPEDALAVAYYLKKVRKDA